MLGMGKEETYREQLEKQRPDREVEEEEIFRPKKNEPAGKEWGPEDKPGGPAGEPDSDGRGTDEQGTPSEGA
jgi:hypothetical protein